ncbi:MAG: hypothetical protein HQL96_14695 [Magnetococcales bacterium]|nr:hypothetical protein [Magnetococcales bacterium]
MRPRRDTFNPKRKIRPAPATNDERMRLEELADKVGYGGNPEHKRNPGDFQLTPPSNPRPGKTLCDSVGIITRSDATKLLREGMKRGLVSDLPDEGWPKNVWAVDADGHPLEAQLENALEGIYHGYPMPLADPFRMKVLER